VRLSEPLPTLEACTYVRELLDEIRILLAHVFRVSAEYTDCSILEFVHLIERPVRPGAKAEARTTSNLRAFAVIFVLAREPLPLEPVEHLADSLRRLREHGFQGDAWGELAVLAEMVDPVLEKCGYDKIVIWQFAAKRQGIR
jgi:hypothetical protein